MFPFSTTLRQPRHRWDPHLVDAAQKTKKTNRSSPKSEFLNNCETTGMSSPTNNCGGKAREHWNETVLKGVESDAAGAQIKISFSRRPVGSTPDHSQFTSHRKTRRDAVLWNDVAVNEDKPNDPRYNRTRAEIATLWRRSKIVNADKSGSSTRVMRNPEYPLASGVTPTYTDAERRQWRNETPTSSSSSSWAWSTWQRP